MEYTASEGNQFLFIAFAAKNTSQDTMNVMNTNFNSYVDDSKIVIQSVVGEVEGYMPLLGAVSSGKSFDGYAIWEVPTSWNSFEFSYIDALTGSDSDAFKINRTDIID